MLKCDDSKKCCFTNKKLWFRKLHTMRRGQVANITLCWAIKNQRINYREIDYMLLQQFLDADVAAPAGVGCAGAAVVSLASDDVNVYDEIGNNQYVGILTEDEEFVLLLEDGTGFLSLDGGTSTVAGGAAGLTMVWSSQDEPSGAEGGGGADLRRLMLDEPMDGSTPLIGDLQFTATYQPSGYVELTQPVINTRGAIIYPMSLIGDATTWEASFDFWAGGGTGADAVWLFMYASSASVSEGTPPDGVNFFFSEYTNYAGVSMSSGYGGSAPVLDSSLSDSTWRTARIVCEDMQVGIYINDSILMNIDLTEAPRDFSGQHFGLAARCGGENNYHRVRNFRITA
jgi:hypothetical protein